MSYNSYGISYAGYAQGTLMSGTASANVSAQATAVTYTGHLLVLVVYATVDPGNARDAGEGWVLLDSGFDSTNNFGIAMWATLSNRTGTTRNGLTLASAGDWASAMAIFDLSYPHLRFDLAGKVGSRNWYSATADARSMQWNPYLGAGWAGNGLQGIELLAAGCYNGGTVPTATAPTGYLERVDQGVVAAPSMNVSLNYRSPSGTNISTNYAGTTVTASTYYTTSGAQTNRASVRGFIPIVGMTNRRGWFLSSRRFMG